MIILAPKLKNIGLVILGWGTKMDSIFILMGVVALLLVVMGRSWRLALLSGSLVLLSGLIVSVILSYMSAALGFFLFTGICWAILGVISGEEDNSKRMRGKKIPIRDDNHFIGKWCSA